MLVFHLFTLWTNSSTFDSLLSLWKYSFLDHTVSDSLHSEPSGNNLMFRQWMISPKLLVLAVASAVAKHFSPACRPSSLRTISYVLRKIQWKTPCYYLMVSRFRRSIHTTEFQSKADLEFYRATREWNEFFVVTKLMSGLLDLAILVWQHPCLGKSYIITDF